MTVEETAQWMVDQLTDKSWLDQETVAWELLKRDKSLVYYNEAGNLAISKPVLATFRKKLPDNVVWSRGERHWRFRKPYDRPGRMQD